VSLFTVEDGEEEGGSGGDWWREKNAGEWVAVAQKEPKWSIVCLLPLSLRASERRAGQANSPRIRASLSRQWVSHLTTQHILLA